MLLSFELQSACQMWRVCACREMRRMLLACRCRGVITVQV